MSENERIWLKAVTKADKHIHSEAGLYSKVCFQPALSQPMPLTLLILIILQDCAFLFTAFCTSSF